MSLNHQCACLFIVEVEQGTDTLLLVSALIVKKSFSWSIWYHAFYIFVLSWMISRFKKNPEHKMLFHALKHSKSVMCPMEKIYMLDKFHLGMNFIVLLAMSLMLMNQQSLLNEVSLNGNTYKHSFVLISS